MNKYDITLLIAAVALLISIATKIRDMMKRNDSTLIARGVSKIEAATIMVCALFLFAGIFNIKIFWDSHARFVEFAVPKHMESPYEAFNIEKLEILERELLNESEEFRYELREVMIYKMELYKAYTGIIYLATSIVQGLFIFETGEIHIDGILHRRRKYKWDEIRSYEWAHGAEEGKLDGKIKLTFDVKNGMISRKLFNENVIRLFLYMDRSDFQTVDDILKMELAGGKD